MLLRCPRRRLWDIEDRKRAEMALQASERELRLIVDTQNGEGGWRYQPERRDADLSVNLDPKDSANYANRAAVMRALNRSEDAIADLRKGLSLNPNAVRKSQLEGALRELGATP